MRSDLSESVDIWPRIVRRRSRLQENWSDSVLVHRELVADRSGSRHTLSRTRSPGRSTTLIWSRASPAFSWAATERGAATAAADQRRDGHEDQTDFHKARTLVTASSDLCSLNTASATSYCRDRPSRARQFTSTRTQQVSDCTPQVCDPQGGIRHQTHVVDQTGRSIASISNP